jgi:colanic acid/amylovoran biosynthesis glycosyltransferase
LPIVASYCADFLKSDMQHLYRQLSRQLDEGRRWQPRVITHRRENESLFPWPGKKLRVLPKHPLRFFRRLWHRQLLGRPVPPTLGEVREFLYQVLRFDARVVHIYFGHVAVRWLPVLMTCPRPVVVSFHGADVGVGVTTAQLSPVFHHAALVLARSGALLDDLRSHGCPAGKLRLHRTGVPVDFFAPPASPRRAPADGAWHLVQACRFVGKKGLATTLRAFARIAPDFPAATLTLVGHGPERDRLRALAGELGIAGRVGFPGFLPPAGVRDVFHRSHLFLHPSESTADGNREGVPNSLLEAMATGLPVAATRHGGIPEAVDDGVSGWLVPERDPDALAAAIRRALPRFDTMGAAARAAVIERFDPETQARRLEEIYDEAVARSSQSKTGS